MPRQQQYYQDPARYFTEKEARRDQGFRDILNMMMMKKQQEKEQARLAWEQKFQEKQFASLDESRRRTGEHYDYLESRPPALSDFEKKLKSIDELPPDLQGPARAALYQIPSSKPTFTNEQMYQHQRNAEKEAKTKIEDERKRHVSLVGSTKGRLEKERTRLMGILNKAEPGNVPSKLKPGSKEYEQYSKHIYKTYSETQKKIDNINSALSNISIIETQLSSGYPLGRYDLSEVKKMNNISSVLNGAFLDKGTDGQQRVVRATMPQAEIPPNAPTATDPKTGARAWYDETTKTWKPIK